MKMESLTPECYSILKHYHDRYKLYYDMFAGYDEHYDPNFPFENIKYIWFFGLKTIFQNFDIFGVKWGNHLMGVKKCKIQ